MQKITYIFIFFSLSFFQNAVIANATIFAKFKIESTAFLVLNCSNDLTIQECTFDTDSSILAQEFLDVSIIIGGENLSAVFDPAFAFSPMYAKEGTICTNLVKNDDDGETYNCIKDVFVNVDMTDSISRSLLLGDVTIESDE